MIQYLHRLKNKKGFTMVELVVVIGIMAVLSAIFIANLIGGNTDKILAANANANVFFTAAQLTMTNAQLTERTLVDYAGTDTKFIEYKDGANTLGGKYFFMEARFKGNGIVGLHAENTINRLMAKPEPDSTNMTALESYLATNINEYISETADGYFYAMCDENFKVLFTHFCESRLPEYTTQGLSDYREELMIGTGIKLADSASVLGTCADKYIIPDTGELGTPDTGDYAFGIPVSTDADFGKYLA